jgi:hypothetical protein
MIKLFKIGLLAVSMFVFNSFAIDEKAIVDGASQFIIERAQQNYLFIYEKEIKNDSLFKCYFPKTVKALSDLDLAMLLTNQKYIKENILTDIENIGYLAIKPSLDSMSSKIIIPLKTVTDSLAKYDTSFDKALLKDIRKTQRELKIKSSVKYQDLSTIWAGAKNIVDILDSSSAIDAISHSYEQLEHDSLIKPRLREFGTVKFIGDFYYFRQIAHSLFDKIEVICDTNISFTSRVVTALDVIYEVEILRQNEEKKIDNKFKERFYKCKKFCLFFSQICDAKSPEAVKQILSMVSLPPVSFELKRQDSTFGVYINSYLGVCGGYEFGSKQTYYGIFAPIGIEFSFGHSCGWSTGILIPMIDLGKAINAQIYKDKTPQIAEIIAPGIGLAFGTPSIPLSLNLFYSYGMSITNSSPGESHVGASFAFDMPLMKLFSINGSHN